MAFRNLPEMPCGPILELHGQRKRFHVPFGLKRLIEDMTREVLRFQPDNIFDFLAAFMEARLKKKEAEDAQNQRRKSWQVHRWSYEGPSVLEPDELKEFLDQLPAPADQVEHHAVVIQSAFRGYQARKKVKEIRRSLELDGGQRRLSETEDKEGDGRRDSTDSENNKKTERRNTLDLTPENVTEEELKSVVTIQAAFRGMQARNEVKKLRASVGQVEGVEAIKEKQPPAPPAEEPPTEEVEPPAADTEKGEHPPEEAVNTEVGQNEAPHEVTGEEGAPPTTAEVHEEHAIEAGPEENTGLQEPQTDEEEYYEASEGEEEHVDETIHQD